MSDNIILKEDKTVMALEPLPDKSPDEVLAWYKQHSNEAGLAAAFAAASNEAWWLADDIDDYEEGSTEYKEIISKVNMWFRVLESLEDAIYDILQHEAVIIPESGKIVVQRKFMERNDYYYSDGWWIEKQV